MHPELLTLDLLLFTVRTTYYRLFLVLAVMTACAIGVWFIRKSGVARKPALLTLAASVLVFPIGARLLNAALRPDLYLREPARLWAIEPSGLSLFGGTMLSVVVAWTMARAMRLDFWRFCDAVVPGFGLGLAVMRIGCLLNGCCFGRPTSLPWGMHYPGFGQTHLWQVTHGMTDIFTSLPVHPTQLYEAAYASVGAALALWLTKKTRSGVPAVAFALWLTVFRLGNHYLRALPYGELVNSAVYPALYAAIAFSCIMVLRNLLKTAEPEKPCPMTRSSD